MRKLITALTLILLATGFFGSCSKSESFEWNTVSVDGHVTNFIEGSDYTWMYEKNENFIRIYNETLLVMFRIDLANDKLNSGNVSLKHHGDFWWALYLAIPVNPYQTHASRVYIYDSNDAYKEEGTQQVASGMVNIQEISEGYFQIRLKMIDSQNRKINVYLSKQMTLVEP